MKYNPAIHHRRSIRLKGYNYAQAGLYFVTICAQEHTHYFGEILDGVLQLNGAGSMVEKWYNKLPEKFPQIICHEMVIMPNHFHCIIEIVVPVNTDVGADPCVCPNSCVCSIPGTASLGENVVSGSGNLGLGEHVGSPLHRVIQWFKTMTTNEYIRNVKQNNWRPFNKKLWQRNYYEHIIRNERSHQNIANYILNNPINWQKDKFYN